MTSFPMLVLVILGDFVRGAIFSPVCILFFCNPWPFLAHFNEI